MLGTTSGRLASVFFACTIMTALGCKALSPPLISAIVYPLWRPSSDSIDPSDYRTVTVGHRSALAGLFVGILRTPGYSTGSLTSRADESSLLRDYLHETGLFARVELVDDPVAAGCDFAISCSADAIGETKLDRWFYTFNWVLLGLGFVLGIPYQDTEASYLVEAVFYEIQPPRAELAGACIVFNHRRWYGHNMYWEPDVYGAASFEPAFEQLLYDFLVESGCLR